MSSRFAGLVLVASLRLVAGAADLPVEQIVQQLETADAARRASFPGCSSTRQYVVENGRFGVKASMKVQVDTDAHGAKQFRVLEVKGPGPIRKLVFDRMLKTESAASAPDAQAATRISAKNYSFRIVESSTVDGKLRHVLELEPRTPNPLLLRGRVWVDAETSAVIRIEGAPAKNPSFWVRKTHFVHEYTNVGGYWLASLNKSESEIRIFGVSVVTIRYEDYKLKAPAE